jgi:hypothetical protein
MVVGATAMVASAGPKDGVKEVGAGWRQGAIKQDKALLEKYPADDMVVIRKYSVRRENSARIRRSPGS